MNPICQICCAFVLITLSGCVGPMTYRQAKLPDGQEVRAYQAGAFLAPSTTFMATKAAGSTNWVVGQIFSGPGLVPGAATGGGIAAAGALVRPDKGNTTTIVAPTTPAPPMVSKGRSHQKD